jgi:hypothetical protein
MFAIIAAVLFAFALLFDWLNTSIGDVITVNTLMLAGLLCLALHFAEARTWGRRWSSRRRRR